MKRRLTLGALLGLFLSTSLWAQQVEVEELILDNGMTFLFVPRKGDPNVAAGWVAKVGSANERPGITGISHLFEHMMFKGTTTIGSKDVEENLRVMNRMDQVKAQLRVEEEDLIRQHRLGLIDDVKAPENRSARHQKLLKEFEELSQREKDLLVKNEFDQIYTQYGASSMNATTNRDFTFYFINVPANKLELWFWMESDRLLNPVFREFYSERDVVHEERRLRTDSTPTGRFREQFEAMFWTSHPYGWPVVGWPSDLEGITREEALSFYDIYYAPNNIAMCLVGDFSVDEAKSLAERYFSRMKRNPVEPEPVRTQEIQQQAEKRMVAYAETNPEVGIRYHTVADGHADEPALTVLSSILSGRTGRLTKSLVLDQKVANQAFAFQRGGKWAGSFSLRAVAKPGKDPLEVEKALHAEIDKIKKELVSDRELQKVKNRSAADEFRRIQSNFFIMFQLAIAESNRGWRTFNEDPKEIQAVSAEDIRRVANKYFVPEQSAVALYYTKESDTPETDPVLAGMTLEQKTRYKQFKGMVDKIPLDRINQMLERLSSDELPEAMKQVAPAYRKLLEERLKKEKGGNQ